MNDSVQLIMILAALTSLAMLASSRLKECIRLVAIQGCLLSVLPLVIDHEGITLQMGLMAVVSLALKGLLFPIMLNHVLRETNVRREVEPYVGYNASVLIGVATFAIVFWLGSNLPLPPALASSHIITIAIFNILAGLFLIASRRKALTQVLGYLVMENGIYAFGVALARHQPFMVELGVLLDVFVAVFVMGIAVMGIQHEFDHIDIDRLTASPEPSDPEEAKS